MQKYDKIYVIDYECPSYIDPIRDADGNALMEHEGSVIVLTVEELREVWAIANERGYHVGQYGNSGIHPKDLNEYLQSKGIQIP